MAQHQKIPYPPYPFRYNYPFVPPTLQNLKLTQQFMPQIPPISTSTSTNNTNNISPHNFFPPRMFNPFMNPYGMMPIPPMPPYPPYLNMMRSPPMPLHPPQFIKAQNELSKKTTELSSPISKPYNAFFHNSNNPSSISTTFQIPSDLQKNKHTSKNFKIEHQEQEKPQSPQIKLQSLSSNQTPNSREKSKTKVKPQKQIKHSDAKLYEPLPLKKKVKKDQIFIDNSTTRETRQKKQNIEKIMMLVMKQKPLRDRAIKIGKQYQAHIPESYINQYEYNLKIKLEKKKNLMNRFVEKDKN